MERSRSSGTEITRCVEETQTAVSQSIQQSWCQETSVGNIFSCSTDSKITKPPFPKHLRKKASRSVSRKLSKGETAGKRINEIRESVFLKSALNDINLGTWNFEEDPKEQDENNNYDNNIMHE